MKKTIPLLFGVLLLGFSCQKGPEQKEIPPPEEVIKKYQAHIDNNEFEKAIQLSTVEGARLLQEIAASITPEELELAKINTIFHNIDCKTDEEIAICLCDMEDEYERYQAEFILVLSEDTWLVDAPEEGQDQEEVNEIVEGVLENVKN